MTVEKGRPWGGPGALPPDGVIVRSDAEARAVVTEARTHGAPIPPLGLLGGDLCRTLGGQGDEARLHRPDATTVTCDLGSVLVDGVHHWFVAHLVARNAWWRGRVVAAMNAEWIGGWDVAPRSHPGDGLLDIFDGHLSLDDRVKARRRLPHGGHLPHPSIHEQRVPALQVDLHRPTGIWLDGERVGTARTLSIRVEPDALTCVV